MNCYKPYVLLLMGACLLSGGCVKHTVPMTCRNYTNYNGPVNIFVNGKANKTAQLKGKNSIDTVTLTSLNSGINEITVHSNDGAYGTVAIDTRRRQNIMAVRDPARPSGFGFLVSEAPFRF